MLHVACCILRCMWHAACGMLCCLIYTACHVSCCMPRATGHAVCGTQPEEERAPLQMLFVSRCLHAMVTRFTQAAKSAYRVKRVGPFLLRSQLDCHYIDEHGTTRVLYHSNALPWPTAVRCDCPRSFHRRALSAFVFARRQSWLVSRAVVCAHCPLKCKVHGSPALPGVLRSLRVCARRRCLISRRALCIR